MQKLLIFFILAINFSCIANSDQSFLQDFNATNPHRIYFGPDVFLFNLNTNVEEVDVTGTKVFGGLRFGYEYLRPQFVYMGLEYFSSACDSSFHTSYRDKKSQDRGFTGFGCLDMRLGYTFLYKNGLLTPFIGFGGYAFGNGRNSRHVGFEEIMLYYEGGIRSRYEISSTFNMGLNLKAFHTMDREKRFKHIDVNVYEHHEIWGSEIGIPLIWVSHRRPWDIQLEPYVLSFIARNTQNIYGARLLFGYRF